MRLARVDTSSIQQQVNLLLKHTVTVAGGLLHEWVTASKQAHLPVTDAGSAAMVVLACCCYALRLLLIVESALVLLFDHHTADN